jgi:hypothetical protein
MSKKAKEDYEGYYRIARSPMRMKEHNQVSWDEIEKLSSSIPDGKMDFNQLSKLVEDHQHGTKSASHPYQFITYCIESGWLE